MSAPTTVVHCRRDRADVYIGRPGPFGNPFKVNTESQRQRSIELFRDWLTDQPDLLWLARKRLPGKTLGCWCAPKPCHGDVLREIADSPTSSRLVPPQPIFVFGSNLDGRHGRGAAAYARDAFGAEAGVGEGLTGDAYAVPTKDEALRPLPLQRVLSGLGRFFEFARGEGSELQFRLTRVGCGLAGFDESPIRDFCLNRAGSNVELPGAWLAHATPIRPRVIVAGSRSFDDRGRAFRALDQVRSKLGDFEIVSGGARGADMLGEAYAVEHELPFRRFPADWDGLGKVAGRHRNEVMAWHSTHLLAFHVGESPGTAHMISAAHAGGLRVAVIRV